MSLAIRGAESLCGAELITSGLTEESRDRDRTVSLLEPGVEVLKNLRIGYRLAALQSQVHNSVCISAATRSLSAIEVTIVVVPDSTLEWRSARKIVMMSYN